jgi:hypothetical protein
MGAIVRVAIFALGVLTMLGGLALIAGGSHDAPGGLWLVCVGAFFTIVPVIERRRYRSEVADKANLEPGPGGGESADAPLEARFRPTAEVFVDPTTGHRMRVLVDARTGERRYVAEA